jgi:hypothetical protein
VRYATLTLVLAAVLAGSAAGQEMRPPHGFATVTVRLVNGTADGRDVSGDTVNLTVYAQGRPVAMLEGKADDDGKAVFENVVTGRGIAAAAQVRHGDMSFGAHAFNLEPGKDSFETVVDVFEVSDDNTKLSVGSHHFILRAQGSGLVITEVMQLTNPTDRAISSALRDANNKPRVVDIRLPAGYHSFEVGEHFQPEALVVTADGFYDTMALPPGTFQAVFSYVLPITGRTVEISKTMSMPVADFAVFSQLPPGSVEGLGPPVGRIPGGEAEYFASAAYDAGDTLAFKVVGFSAEYSDTRDIIILSGIFAIIVLLGVARLVRKPRAS